MATHEADGYTTEKFSGKAEDQGKKEHNRINAGTPPVPATKVSGTNADAKGRNQSAPGNM